jgi:hypothetical protein
MNNDAATGRLFYRQWRTLARPSIFDRREQQNKQEPGRSSFSDRQQHANGTGVLPQREAFPWIARAIESTLRTAMAIEALSRRIERKHQT